ncbi:MAG: helix-turn-helix domain-containing protein [Frankiaceae bacterium]
MPEPTSLLTLAEILRAARIRTGMTQEQLAGLSTVSVRAIRDLEQGRVAAPRRGTIQLLADAMRLSRTARVELESVLDGPTARRLLLGRRADEVAPPPMSWHPLLGREDEVRALTELLGTRQLRLLTLTGLPGAGKSRLAQELAMQMRDRYGVPALWVEIDGGSAAGFASRPDAVVAQVISALVHGGDHEEIAATIGDRSLLLVLDGYQPHAAGAARLDSLLTVCEGLTVLATSCRMESMTGGAQVPVPGLSCGRTPAGAAGGAAIDLMLSFVRCRRPGLSLYAEARARLAEICLALDGLPCALEEAADWLLLLSPEQLHEITVRDPLRVVSTGFAAAIEAALPVSGSPLDVALTALASAPRRWTLDAVAEALSASPAEAVRTLRGLLLRGLVRRVEPTSAHQAGPGGGGFEVLNLVRHVMAARHQCVVSLVGHRGVSAGVPRAASRAIRHVAPSQAAVRRDLEHG